MRTALILLFLLALAAMPGALLPQRTLNANKVADYIAEHGWWGRLLDQLQFYNVYASVWFSAIYILLMISLVGCLLPRTLEYAKALRTKPVLTPRNLSRMPHHSESTVDKSADEVVAQAIKALSGWRKVEREEDNGARTISAERGYLRETGNLVFHFAMLGLIIALAVGKLFGYEGQVIVKADGSQEFCNSGVLGYDSFQPGLRVDGTDLTPFCLKVASFDVNFLPTGQPDLFRANLEYQSEKDLDSGRWERYGLEVNSPLRTDGDRIYLLGHGYAPVFTVTFPNGEKRTMDTQWRPVDQVTFLSEGATKFDPPGITNSEERRTKQIAVTGVFAPTAQLHGSLLNSSFPALNNPMVAVDVMRGDLGIDNGRGQSIFTIDQNQVDNGRLKKVARENLALGGEVKLDDGTVVRFDGVKRWVYLQVSHDPAQVWVLVFAIAIIMGIGASLIIKRRRLWVRVVPAADGRTVVEVGGLARTDQAGYGEEFERLSGAVTGGKN
ncbi:cytochrome C biogenesis protein ResB [Kibdelosporangium aridum]|uniref:Cytochrome C biogenesis protein ResB n=1 Tax=Kibdelosporangium aridum TaxID=2030 RepID=A0A428YWF2_KIBAR|nr:cytochrome c biogenesis protein ResB [Kibdelosporangium aridum]RSM74400.1 cytochrome C biogenesis protein ResB [Kibdelosporangium aridum]